MCANIIDLAHALHPLTQVLCACLLQSGAVAVMLKELYGKTSLGQTGCVLTIHNIAFQVCGRVRCVCARAHNAHSCHVCAGARALWWWLCDGDNLHVGVLLCCTQPCSHTPHTMFLQGHQSPKLLDLVGLSRKAVYTPDRMQDSVTKSPAGEYDINIMKVSYICGEVLQQVMCGSTARILVWVVAALYRSGSGPAASPVVRHL